VTTICTPASGTLFSAGTTSVTCSATDSRGVVATCSFGVRVIPPPRLTATRIVAFGDSLTAGRYADPVSGFMITVSPFAYPELVLPMLRARYRLQSIDMVNEGQPGERAFEGGDRRFRSTLLQHRPGLVLIMEGTNDLLDTDKERAMTFAIQALTGMIREAKSQNVKVALATIPPQRPNGTRNRGAVAAVIPGFNDRIRTLATAESVALVDVYTAMKDDLSLIGDDDLHPTPRGFEVIAKTFFEAIKAGFEEVPPAVLGAIR
jgi:lysophospholipase L1-like esterase